MAITFTDITDEQKLEVANLMQKLEAIKGELADIQTERAAAEIGWSKEEQDLKAEQNKLYQVVRDVRKATVNGQN